eukprot:s192_g15.t1
MEGPGSTGPGSLGGVRIKALRAPAFKRPASAMESSDMETDPPAEPSGAASTGVEGAPATTVALGSNETDGNMAITPDQGPGESLGEGSTAVGSAKAAESFATEIAVGGPQHRAAVLAAQAHSPPTGIGSLSRVLDSIEEEFAAALGALSKSIFHEDREKVGDLTQRKEVLNGLREAGQLEEDDGKLLLTSPERGTASGHRGDGEKKKRRRKRKAKKEPAEEGEPSAGAAPVVSIPSTSEGGAGRDEAPGGEVSGDALLPAAPVTIEFEVPSTGAVPTETVEEAPHGELPRGGCVAASDERKAASVAAPHPEAPPSEVLHGDPKAAGPRGDPKAASSAVPGETSVPKASELPVGPPGEPKAMPSAPPGEPSEKGSGKRKETERAILAETAAANRAIAAIDAIPSLGDPAGKGFGKGKEKGYEASAAEIAAMNTAVGAINEWFGGAGIKPKEEISHADTTGSNHGEGVEVPLRGGDAASSTPSTGSTPNAAPSESEESEADPCVPFEHGSYGPGAKPPPVAWLAAKAAVGAVGDQAALPKAAHGVPHGDGAKAPPPKDGQGRPHGEGVEAPLPKEPQTVPHGDDDEDRKGKEKRRGKPSSETEAVLKAKGVPIAPFPATFPPSSEAAPKASETAPKDELKEESKEEAKEEVKEESKEMTPHEKRIAEMKKKIAEFRLGKGYGTASSSASPMAKAKEAAYRALPGTAPRPAEDPPAAAPGRPPAKAMPAEIAGQTRPSQAPGGGDGGDGGGDDEEYSLETIDEEEGEEEEDRRDDPLVLIEGAAISWQLKVFVSLENESMEDLLYRVRRMALDEMGAAFPGELILRVSQRPSAGTVAGAAEAALKGVLPAENGLDITIVEHQAVRMKLYDRRPNVTPFVRGDPWTDGCVAVGWMTNGLKFVCFSERLGFRMKYLNCSWTGYTLFFQQRAGLAP